VNYYDLIDRFELCYIEVSKEYRNKKIGSKLVEELIRIGQNKNIINITLEVSVDNQVAIKLYEKYDFKIVATRKGYYNGIDGYLMERKMM
jgi:ribosomal-protein-alanine N-acetyltransferase